MVRERYGISLTPKFDITVSKSDRQSIEMIDKISELVRSEEDYMSITFSLAPTEETDSCIRKRDELTSLIEDEELDVRERLSKQISKYKDAAFVKLRQNRKAGYNPFQSALCRQT